MKLAEMGFPGMLNIWKQRLGWASSVEVLLLLLVSFCLTFAYTP